MTVWVEIEGQRRRVEIEDAAFYKEDNGALFAVDGTKIGTDARMLRPGVLSLISEGRQYSCVLDGDAVVIAGRRFPFSLADPRSLSGQQVPAGRSGGLRQLKASMPGRVVRVLIKPGDEVHEHQGIVVIEAMKMQNELKSPKAGLVTKIAVEEGAAVSAGDVLAVIE